MTLSVLFHHRPGDGIETRRSIACSLLKHTKLVTIWYGPRSAGAGKVSKRNIMSAGVKLMPQEEFLTLKTLITSHFRLYFTVSMDLLLLQYE
ncbi:hypothetical protein CE195_06535 [Sodalis-like symbiont of Philaenus spumarius]|nr:hypothetical protein CE195_06535 [Sodalis-like symbiont of Philaenus spumarius]